jgi:hypothetical protein
VNSLLVNTNQATITNSGAATVKSLDVSNGGITNAGAISGATTISGTSLTVSGTCAPAADKRISIVRSERVS